MGGVDVGYEGDVFGLVERAVKGLHGVHDRLRHQGIAPAGQQEHPVAAQPGEIVDVAGFARCARGGDAPLRLGRAEERSRHEVRADVQRPEHALRVIGTGAQVWAGREDAGPHHPGRMGDMELVGHEAARGYPGYRDARRVDAQRLQAPVRGARRGADGDQNGREENGDARAARRRRTAAAPAGRGA
jgi:hypothetical protein